jgi:hypothetical protein
VRLDPWIAIPALLIAAAGVFFWVKAIERLPKGSKAARINTSLFNVFLFIPMLIAIPLFKLGFVAVYPFLNFGKIWREDGLLLAILVILLWTPAYALLAVIVLTLFGKIPLY